MGKVVQFTRCVSRVRPKKSWDERLSDVRLEVLGLMRSVPYDDFYEERLDQLEEALGYLNDAGANL